MSDTELTELTGPEADRLRALLHRAADSLDVTTPDHLEIEPARRRPNPGRWLGAAAAVLVVAAIGAAWWLSGDDGQRIDTGPAEPPVTVAPQVLEESGIWRLPEGLDGYRIVGARADDASSVYNADRPGVVEVDDPGPGSRSRSSELTLVDDDGAEALVTMVGGDAAPWFYIFRFQMIAEFTSIALPRVGTFTRSVTRRSDLGRNVLESTITADGLDTIRSLAAVTDDGVTLSVTPSYPEAGAPDTLPSLTEKQQLRIINSLRSMPEDEFRARLEELGAEFIGANSAGVTTTIEGAPGG